MKKLNWLMAMLSIVALSFAACKEEPMDEPNKPTPPTPSEELTFKTSVLASDERSVTFEVTPSDLEAEYLTVILMANVVENCATDADIVKLIYDDIKAYAEANDTTFAAYMAEKSHKGVTNKTSEGLTPNTNYYILNFGVDSANDYAANSAVAKLRFKTAEIAEASCSFELTAVVNKTSAAIKVKPSIKTQQWHLINVPADMVNEYTDANGEYGWTNREFFQKHMESEIEAMRKAGMTTDEIVKKSVFTGYRTLNATGLEPKTKYASMVACVNVDGDYITINSEPKEMRFNSGEASTSDLTFEIEVSNIEHYAADIRIIPSDVNAEYYYYIGYIDTNKKSMKPAEIAELAVTEYIYYWDNYTELKRREPSKGIVDLTGDNRVELNIAETEYYIVAFSFDPNPNYGKVINEETGEYDYNPGTISSTPVYVSFMTSDQGDPMTAEFSFKASDVGPYGFHLEIETNDPTIYYQPGVAYAEGFTPEAAIDASSAMLSQLMQMCMEGQSPSLTIHEALEQKCSHLYRNGNGAFTVANLEPDTEYIGYVLAIDATTGTFARCVYSDVIAKTKTPGNVTPEIELLGVYNGDDEAGSIFGDAAKTEGRPIVAVQMTNTAGATAIFGAITSDPIEDVNALPDRYIISDLRDYWQEINLTVPYYFFVAEWDINQTVVAYAKDANGSEGGVARLGVKPVTPGDIEELRGYVDAVNKATPAAKSLAASVVYEEQSSEPTMECVWSEEVGAPRAAKVIKHEVEPITVESDVMNLRVIKSFTI